MCIPRARIVRLRVYRNFVWHQLGSGKFEFELKNCLREGKEAFISRFDSLPDFITGGSYLGDGGIFFFFFLRPLTFEIKNSRYNLL